ncbi:MAG: hypothetical protein IT304_02435 [Dehalococcoidia bacterium]|nr:hypothetical protein [Dehalococcoidia bacterium]
MADEPLATRREPEAEVPVYETDLVLSADGHELGRVGAATAAAFQVATPHARDLWVSREAIGRRDDVAQVLYLRCARDELSACTVSPPAL